jgi:hypothetical protein
VSLLPAAGIKNGQRDTVARSIFSAAATQGSRGAGPLEDVGSLQTRTQFVFMVTGMLDLELYSLLNRISSDS